MNININIKVNIYVKININTNINLNIAVILAQARWGGGFPDPSSAKPGPNQAKPRSLKNQAFLHYLTALSAPGAG